VAEGRGVPRAPWRRQSSGASPAPWRRLIAGSGRGCSYRWINVRAVEPVPAHQVPVLIGTPTASTRGVLTPIPKVLERGSSRRASAGPAMGAAEPAIGDRATVLRSLVRLTQQARHGIPP